MLYIPTPFFFQSETNFSVGKSSVQYFMVVNEIFNKPMGSNSSWGKWDRKRSNQHLALSVKTSTVLSPSEKDPSCPLVTGQLPGTTRWRDPQEGRSLSWCCGLTGFSGGNLDFWAHVWNLHHSYHLTHEPHSATPSATARQDGKEDSQLQWTDAIYHVFHACDSMVGNLW